MHEVKCALVFLSCRLSWYLSQQMIVNIYISTTRCKAYKWTRLCQTVLNILTDLRVTHKPDFCTTKCISTLYYQFLNNLRKKINEKRDSAASTQFHSSLCIINVRRNSTTFCWRITGLSFYSWDKANIPVISSTLCENGPLWIPAISYNHFNLFNNWGQNLISLSLSYKLTRSL